MGQSERVSKLGIEIGKCRYVEYLETAGCRINLAGMEIFTLNENKIHLKT